MPSRKRAKGKARKAKARESNCNLILHNDNVCRHGCEVISKDDTCYKFVKQFEVELNVVYDSLGPEAESLFLNSLFGDTIERMKASMNKEYEIIWDSDEETRQKLQSLFVNLGVNLLLRPSTLTVTTRRVQLSTISAIAVLYCHYDMIMNWSEAIPNNTRALRDLYALPYDTLKFFKKRISCQCLKKLYLHERAKPRHATCVCCAAMKERSQLFLCSGCLYSYYCGVECQTKHWSLHKSFCKSVEIDH